MDWVQISIFMGIIGGIATIFALFFGPAFWLSSKIDSIREQMEHEMSEFRKENKAFHSEMKEFHARLFILEDRYLRLREKEE